MRRLRLVALSDDGQSVVLAVEGPDGETEKFELPIDDRLRAAARGDARRLTQIDVDLGTELPPRIIQARIRNPGWRAFAFCGRGSAKRDATASP